MTTPSNPKPRLDQRLTEESHKAAQALLEQFPELRSVAIAFDYELSDAGSLPPGAWISRRPLTPLEVLKAHRAVDDVAFYLRKQHDQAFIEQLQSMKPPPQPSQPKEDKPNASSA